MVVETQVLRGTLVALGCPPQKKKVSTGFGLFELLADKEKIVVVYLLTERLKLRSGLGLGINDLN